MAWWRSATLTSDRCRPPNAENISSTSEFCPEHRELGGNVMTSSRRRFLRHAGAVGVLVVGAGCTGGQGDDGNGDTTGSSGSTDSITTTDSTTTTGETATEVETTTSGATTEAATITGEATTGAGDTGGTTTSSDSTADATTGGSGGSGGGPAEVAAGPNGNLVFDPEAVEIAEITQLTGTTLRRSPRRCPRDFRGCHQGVATTRTYGSARPSRPTRSTLVTVKPA